MNNIRNYAVFLQMQYIYSNKCKKFATTRHLLHHRKNNKFKFFDRIMQKLIKKWYRPKRFKPFLQSAKHGVLKWYSSVSNDKRRKLEYNSDG